MGAAWSLIVFDIGFAPTLYLWPVTHLYGMFLGTPYKMNSWQYEGESPGCNLLCHSSTMIYSQCSMVTGLLGPLVPWEHSLPLNPSSPQQPHWLDWKLLQWLNLEQTAWQGDKWHLFHQLHQWDLRPHLPASTDPDESSARNVGGSIFNLSMAPCLADPFATPPAGLPSTSESSCLVSV